jgi:uncharacterized membrane protein YhiD involved in acid resistance
MEQVGIVLGVLAILVSLAALWFANDLSRRVEEQTRQFLENHVMSLKETVNKGMERLSAIERRNETGDKQLKDLVTEREALSQKFSQAESNLVAIQEKIERLEEAVRGKAAARVEDQPR